MGEVKDLNLEISPLVLVKISTCIEGGNHCLLVVIAGEHDERKTGIDRTDPGEQVDAVHLRHIIIRDDCHDLMIPEIE